MGFHVRLTMATPPHDISRPFPINRRPRGKPHADYNCSLIHVKIDVKIADARSSDKMSCPRVYYLPVYISKPHGPARRTLYIAAGGRRQERPFGRTWRPPLCHRSAGNAAAILGCD